MEKPVTELTLARQTRTRALRELFVTLMWMGHRQLVRRLQTYGLTYPQFVTLASLATHKKPVSMRELREVTLQDAPTMTRIVDRLVKMKWVRRARYEQDRRVVLVEATQTGQTLIKTIRHDLDQDDTMGFGTLSDEELTKMEEMIDHALAVHLKQIGQDRIADIESVKAKLRYFANDPIGFLKTHKEAA